MKLIQSILLCFIVFSVSAQVGIGTTNPTAVVDINTANSSLPALELNPQTTPIGTASGQMAIINDKLYLYDPTRNKWLTVSTSTFSFGREGNSNGHPLEYAGDITDSSPSQVSAGTLVYISLNTSGGNPTKEIGISVFNSSDILASTHSFNLIDGKLIKRDLNIDFEEGDYFLVRVFSDTGNNSVQDVSAVLWTKERKDN